MGCPANQATSVASFLFLRFSQMCLATLLVETRNTTGMSSAAYYFSYYCFLYCAPLCIGASSATANVTPAHLARTNKYYYFYKYTLPQFSIIFPGSIKCYSESGERTGPYQVLKLRATVLFFCQFHYAPNRSRHS